jgi:hypothetical protein
MKLYVTSEFVDAGTRERHFPGDTIDVADEARTQRLLEAGLVSSDAAPGAPAPTNKELRARAKELGLEVPAKAKNAELADAIAHAEAAGVEQRDALVARATELGLEVPADAGVEFLTAAIATAEAPGRGELLIKAKELGLDLPPDVSDADLADAIAKVEGDNG